MDFRELGWPDPLAGFEDREPLTEYNNPFVLFLFTSTKDESLKSNRNHNADRFSISSQKSSDGKSLLPQPSSSPSLSTAYTSFPRPIQNSSPSPSPTTPRPASFDLHIYFTLSELPYAKRLHTRIRHEFPDLRIYPLKENPVGPHPVGMFEINVFSPAELGCMVGWLTVWRGGLSVLVHPNTEMRMVEGRWEGGAEGDHTVRAMW